MIDVKETLNEAEERMEMAAMYLDEQLQRIRAGRANVAILDGIRVSSYGSMVPLNQVASVTVPDPRTIAIKPWDKKAIREIEKAIMDSDVGITPENNGELIRLGIPPLTEDRLGEEVLSTGLLKLMALRDGEGGHRGLRDHRNQDDQEHPVPQRLDERLWGRRPRAGGGASSLMLDATGAYLMQQRQPDQRGCRGRRW